jgi:hypothetical protein
MNGLGALSSQFQGVLTSFKNETQKLDELKKKAEAKNLEI